MLTFLKNKVICDKNNPKFMIMVNCLEQLLYITKHLFYSYKDVKIAKSVFNKFFIDYIPKNNDSVSKNYIFTGSLAKTFSKLYLSIYSMWEKIENESVVYKNKVKVNKITKEDFGGFITESLTKLEKFQKT